MMRTRIITGESMTKQDLQDLRRCAIVALSSAGTAYAKARVTRDVFLATMPRCGLEQLAVQRGNHSISGMSKECSSVK